MSSIKTCCICQRRGHQPRNCWYNDKQDKEAKDLFEIKRKNGKLIKTYKVRNLGTITTDEEKTEPTTKNTKTIHRISKTRKPSTTTKKENNIEDIEIIKEVTYNQSPKSKPTRSTTPQPKEVGTSSTYLKCNKCLAWELRLQQTLTNLEEVKKEVNNQKRIVGSLLNEIKTLRQDKTSLKEALHTLTSK